MSDYLSTVNLLIEYIEENLESNLSLDNLAKLVNYSKYYVQRVFSSVIHMSIHDYITERRLIRAGEEILNGGKIADTALKYGYKSHSGFSNAFKRKFSLTPSMVNECIEIKVNKPLRILEREFFNTDSNLCIYHKLINLDEMPLEGTNYSVNYKDFWNDESMIYYMEHKVISSIKSNKNSRTYCIGIPGNSESEVQYFIGKVGDKNTANIIMPKSLYIKFSYRGNFKENRKIIITDALNCLSTYGIVPNQEKIDHIKIFTKDYLETKIFDIMVPLMDA